MEILAGVLGGILLVMLVLSLIEADKQKKDNERRQEEYNIKLAALNEEIQNRATIEELEKKQERISELEKEVIRKDKKIHSLNKEIGIINSCWDIDFPDISRKGGN